MTRRRRTRGSAPPAPADRARPDEHVWWSAIALAGLGTAVYLNALANPFVMDDSEAIVGNATIRQLWPLGPLIRGPVQSAMAARPIANLSLAVNYALGGLDPFGYHLWNVAVHLAAGLLLFGIVRRTLRSSRFSTKLATAADGLAFASALIWLLHPLQTEVINYVTQRTESMMAVCLLATVYASIRASASGTYSRRWASAAVVACAAGMACKESMVGAPVLVLLYAAVFEDDGVWAALRRRPRFYAMLAATWFVLLALNWRGPRSNSAGFEAGLSTWLYLQNQAVMLATYVERAFWPLRLVVYYGRPRPVSWSQALPGLAIALILLGGTLAAWRRWPAVGFVGAWFVLTIAPTTSVIPIATEVGAERRMYLPLAALVPLAVVGAWRLISVLTTRTTSITRFRIGAGALVLACLPLAVLTVRRNAEYHTAIRLWQTSLDRHPAGGAHYNLGIALADAGRRDEALTQYRAALPDFPEAHYALGFELDKDGKHEEALAQYREFVRLVPTDYRVPAAYNLMGHALAALGRLDEAADAYRRTLEMQPSNGDAQRELGALYLQQQRYADAVAEYRTYLRGAPNDAGGHNNLGMALIGLEREGEAADEFSRVVALQPRDVSARQNLANALAASGRLDEAIVQYRAALTLAPNDALLHSSLGLALAGQGQAEASLQEFQRALALAPDQPEVLDDLAAARQRLGTR